MLLLLLLCIGGSKAVLAQAKKEIKIDGHVAIQNPDIFKKYNWVWLYKGMGNQRRLVDSAQLDADGNFTFSIKPTVHGLYSMDIIKWQTASFWSDADVHVSARGYDTSKVKMRNSGFVEVKSLSAATSLMNIANFNNYLAAQEMDILNNEWISSVQNARSDSAWSKYIRREGLIRKKGDLEALRLQKLIEANPANPGLIYLLSLYPTDSDSKFYEAQLANVLSRYPTSPEVKYLKDTYENKKATRNSLKKGSAVPAIAYPSPDGKIIDIASFKGKYVLVDFWASWCGPCRKAIPEVKELYAKYKDLGFDVLSVSVDSSPDAWRKAMSEENMPWAQVLSPDKDKTMREFMIVGIPTLFLIDREGKIVEKYTGFSQGLKAQIAAAFENGK